MYSLTQNRLVKNNSVKSHEGARALRKAFRGISMLRPALQVSKGALSTNSQIIKDER